MRNRKLFVHVVFALFFFFSFPQACRNRAGRSCWEGGGGILVPCKTVHHATRNTQQTHDTANSAKLKRAVCSFHFSEIFVEEVDFRNSSAVNSFIANELQLDEVRRRAVSEVVGQLRDHLLQNLPSEFSIDKFVKVRANNYVTALCNEC